MNDLDTLRTLRSDVPPAGPDARARARAALLREAAEEATRRRRARVVGRTGGTRLFPLVRLVSAAALVVGLALWFVAVRGYPGEPNLGHGGPQLPVRQDAAGVLRLAAEHALQQPDLTPKPGQFVFIESVGPGGGYYQHDRPVLRQVWLSVDGSKSGLLREIPRSSSARFPDVDLGSSGKPAFMNLPTTGTDMYRYIYDHLVDNGEPENERAFVFVGDLIRERYIRPESLAAVYKAAARIPGVTLERDVPDAVGRRGLAVTMKFRVGGNKKQLLFDPKTYVLLGERDGEISANLATANLRIAVVNERGQLPR